MTLQTISACITISGSGKRLDVLVASQPENEHALSNIGIKQGWNASSARQGCLQPYILSGSGRHLIYGEERRWILNAGGLAKHHIQTGRVLLFFPVSDDLGEGNYLPRARASGREWIAS